MLLDERINSHIHLLKTLHVTFNNSYFIYTVQLGTAASLAKWPSGQGTRLPCWRLPVQIQVNPGSGLRFLVCDQSSCDGYLHSRESKATCVPCVLVFRGYGNQYALTHTNLVELSFCTTCKK